jgi:uncharacterized membrane protein YwzB
MDSTKATARLAGAIYFVFSITAIIGEFFFPAFLVPGDPAATARAITTAEPAYRLAILTTFVTLILFVLLIVTLHKLFKDVDRSQAMLMVLFVAIGIAVALANMMSRFAPLVILNGAGEWSSFTKPQLDTLALGFLRFGRAGSSVVTMFWGLWLFPFGILVIRSGFIPRLFGFLLIVAGVAYLAGSVTAIALPEYRQVVGRVVTPLYFGEVPIIFWLLIKGVRTQAPR